MNSKSHIIVSTCYLGPVSYFARFLQADKITVDVHEHYIKQTYRNRCRIITSNGILDLSIPVVKINGNHTMVKDIQISHAEKWQINHWRAMVSSYSNSPFFLYYGEELAQFFHSTYVSLLDFNKEINELILSLIGVEKKYEFSTAYYEEHPGDEIEDLRFFFSPKVPTNVTLPEYRQVFSEKHGFYQDLSIVDLLFNLGPETKDYLLNLSF